MAEQREKLKKELEECIKSIYDALLEAKYNFHIWLEIFPIEAIVHILNRYKGFFTPTIMAHKKMLFVNLYKVLDYRKDSYHFKYLFNLLDELNDAMIDVEECRKQIFDNHATTIKHLKRFRHKLVSHIDKELVPSKKRNLEDQMDPEIRVTIGEAKALLETLEDVINDISVKVLRRHLLFNLDRAKDPEQIIMIIGAAIAAERGQNKLKLEYIYPKASSVSLLNKGTVK